MEKEISKGKIKIGGYSHKKADARRERKKYEANLRNTTWKQLSPKQKLESLAKRRGESKQQIARINKSKI